MDGADDTLTVLTRFVRQSPTLSDSHHTEPVPGNEAGYPYNLYGHYDRYDYINHTNTTNPVKQQGSG